MFVSNTTPIETEKIFTLSEYFCRLFTEKYIIVSTVHRVLTEVYIRAMYFIPCILKAVNSLQNGT